MMTARAQGISESTAEPHVDGGIARPSGRRSSESSSAPPVILRIPNLETVDAAVETLQQSPTGSRWPNIAWWAFVIVGTILTIVLLSGGKPDKPAPSAAP